MELLILERNLELPLPTKLYIEKKLRRLERKLSSIGEAKVEVARQNTRAPAHRVVVEVTLNCNGSLIRGEERASNVMEAVDAVVDVLGRRLVSYKGRLYRSAQAKKSGRSVSIRTLEAPADFPQAGEEPLTLPNGRAVRVKRYPIKPMSVEEAAVQMELLGHDFFLFSNSETEQYNVLYRRRDGNYGLIEPEPE